RRVLFRSGADRQTPVLRSVTPRRPDVARASCGYSMLWKTCNGSRTMAMQNSRARVQTPEPRVMFPTWLACRRRRLRHFGALCGGPGPEITHGRARARMGTPVFKRSRPRCDQRWTLAGIALRYGRNMEKPVDTQTAPTPSLGGRRVDGKGAGAH